MKKIFSILVFLAMAVSAYAQYATPALAERKGCTIKIDGEKLSNHEAELLMSNIGGEDYSAQWAKARGWRTAGISMIAGGGAIAALSGAFGAALAAMVGSLTLGKKGYEDAQEEMAEMTDKGKNLAKKLLAAMDKDANSFNGYMAALGMPKGTEEEKTIRRAAMQDALKSASLVPLNTAKAAAEFPLAEAAVKSGNRNAVTDGLVAAMMARAAVLGALLNVKINLGSIKDEAFVQELQAACGALQKEAIAAEQRILDLVPELK